MENFLYQEAGHADNQLDTFLEDIPTNHGVTITPIVTPNGTQDFYFLLIFLPGTGQNGLIIIFCAAVLLVVYFY